MAEFSGRQTQRDSEGLRHAISLISNVRNATINGGSFTMNVQTICRHRGPTYTQGAPNQAPEFAFSPVGMSDDIIPHGVGSQAFFSLFSKIRRLMCNLPAPHLALAQDCAHLVRRQSTSRGLGRNTVCVVAPWFTSYLFSVLPAEVQLVVMFIWASTAVIDFMYPLGFGYGVRPDSQVTVLDALGNELTFPWAACENMTTFHEQYLERSRNQPGFLFVKTKSYDVRYNGHILQQADWKAIQPFTEIYVDFVIIQGDATSVMCPWCKTVHSPPEGRSDDTRTCSRCGRDFLMSSLAGSGNIVPTNDLRIREDLQRSLSEAILRVRVKCHLWERKPMGPTPPPNFPSSSDSAPASPVGLSVNFTEYSRNKPSTMPYEDGEPEDGPDSGFRDQDAHIIDGVDQEDSSSSVSVDTVYLDSRNELFTTPYEDEEPEDDPGFLDQDDHIINGVGQEDKSPSVSGVTISPDAHNDTVRHSEKVYESKEKEDLMGSIGVVERTEGLVGVVDSGVVKGWHGLKKPLESRTIDAWQEKPRRHNIILLGEAGCGKSSIVNMIIGDAVAKVSNLAGVCTFQNESYEADIDGTAFRIFDTAGLDEIDEGRVPHWKAVQGLYTLIRQLDDVSLLVFCIRGRIKANTRANWILFNKLICGEVVPTIAVVTGLEDEDNLDDWWRREENKEVFRRYRMRPRGIGCVVSARGHQNQYAEKYRESQEKLRNLILNSYRRQPWNEEKEAWFSRMYCDVYHVDLFFFNRRSKDFTPMMKNAIEEFTREVGMDEEDSEKLKRSLLLVEKMIEKRNKPSRVIWP